MDTSHRLGALRTRDALSLVSCAVACAVLLDASWYIPNHRLAVSGALALLLGLGFWLDWRSGLLALKLSELPAEIRRRGVMTFGFARPLSLLSSTLCGLASCSVNLGG